ncbi:hypothetical protein SCHPADRAFT_869114 [Schizopora paradoxa]|uniref:N-acetyltransferase domain-containing protein n=1 Tax=Schizopora paradoxa TaxID=27342 RepID=A0A0H2RXI1_9AGAM|nr:hypothetical protein SCHPADRAFT_869114 [Schizopora paradoxa]
MDKYHTIKMVMQSLRAFIAVYLPLRCDQIEDHLEAPSKQIPEVPSQNQHHDPPSNAVDLSNSDWCNTYAPKPTPTLSPDELYGPTPYDINFVFPYLPHSLETRQIKLVPFVPRIHAQDLFEHATACPRDFSYLRMPVPATLEDLLTHFELHIRRDPSSIAFAVLGREDEDHEWDYGAVLCLTGCDPERLSAEIATGICFRPYVRSNGAILAATLLARYCMNSTTASPPGLGLRRLSWISHTNNIPSLTIGSTIGFKVESIRRWHRMATDGKANNGRALRDGDPSGLPGVDVNTLVMCWEDWEEEGSKLAEQILSSRLLHVKHG